MTAYTIELYGCDGNNFTHADLTGDELRVVVRLAVALNERASKCQPVMHVYGGHVEPSFFGNDGAFEEIV